MRWPPKPLPKGRRWFESITGCQFICGVFMYAIVDCHRGVKCPRCWSRHYLPNQTDDLCDRCQLVLLETDSTLRDTIIKSRLKEMKRYCVRDANERCNHSKCCRSVDGLSGDPMNGENLC